MTDNATLLKLKPADALVRMLNEANQTLFQFDAFTPGTPVVANGLSTTVQLTARHVASPLEMPKETGSVNLTYNRLDLGAHFANALDGFTVTLPSSTRVILDELKARLGQEFYDEDIVLEEIMRANAINYRIKAKAESWRWSGYIEVTVANLTDLPTYLDASLPAGTPRLGTLTQLPDLHAPNVSLPTLNGSNAKNYINLISVGDLAEENGMVVTAINKSVPQPSHRLSSGGNAWQISATPGPRNLTHATVLGVSDLATGINKINPLLDQVLTVQLDPSFCTDFTAGPLLIPYIGDAYPAATFGLPRLTCAGVAVLTDASLFNVYLNDTYHKGDIITSLDTVTHFEIEPGIEWIADPDNPGPTNLYNAVVQYNGQVRGFDVTPLHQEMDRVMVVTLSDSNTAYRGNFPIYYRSPIRLPATVPNGTIGSVYDYQFSPTEGEAPYVYAVVAGALEGQQSIDAAGHFTGTPTTAGTYAFTLQVTDNRGCAVLFNYTYSVSAQVQRLAINGSFPNGAVGKSYTNFLSVSGGLAPYSNLRVLAGSPPSGLAFAIVSNSIRLSGTPTLAGTYTFTVAIDSTDGQTATLLVTMTIS